MDRRHWRDGWWVGRVCSALAMECTSTSQVDNKWEEDQLDLIVT